jgi:hypothetical protein
VLSKEKVVDYFVQGNEISVSIKGEEFLDELINYYLGKDFVPCS